MTTTKQYYTIPEMAEAKGVSEKTIKRWLTAHPGVKKHHLDPAIPHRIFIAHSDVERYVKYKGIKPLTGKQKKEAPRGKDREQLADKTPAAPPGVVPLKTEDVPREKPAMSPRTTLGITNVNTLAWSLVLLPSLLVAYLVGAYAPSVFGYSSSALVGAIWAATIGLINLSFYLTNRLSKAARSLRIVLVVCSSILGVQVIDSFLFAQTIKNIQERMRPPVNEDPYLVSLAQVVKERQDRYDTSLEEVRAEITQRGGYGENAKALLAIARNDSISLALARARYTTSVENKQNVVSQQRGARDWLADLNALHRFVLSSPLAFIIYLLSFCVIMIIELLPLILIPS